MWAKLVPYSSLREEFTYAVAEIATLAPSRLCDSEACDHHTQLQCNVPIKYGDWETSTEGQDSIRGKQPDELNSDLIISH